MLTLWVLHNKHWQTRAETIKDLDEKECSLTHSLSLRLVYFLANVFVFTLMCCTFLENSAIINLHPFACNGKAGAYIITKKYDHVHDLQEEGSILYLWLNPPKKNWQTKSRCSKDTHWLIFTQPRNKFIAWLYDKRRRQIPLKRRDFYILIRTASWLRQVSNASDAFLFYFHRVRSEQHSFWYVSFFHALGHDITIKSETTNTLLHCKGATWSRVKSL